MRAIVTGGAGFIGSHVVDALLARGDEVHVLDNLSTGQARERAPPAPTLHERDIREPLATSFARRGPRSCFHLAAQADVRVSVERPEPTRDVNVLGTIHVLQAARQHGARVVFSSTGGAIYGECERPAREDDPREPLSPYGTAKLAAESYVSMWNRLHGGQHTVLRYANVYGPRQVPGWREPLSRSSSSGSARASRRRSSATGRRRGTSSTSSTSSPRRSPPSTPRASST